MSEFQIERWDSVIPPKNTFPYPAIYIKPTAEFLNSINTSISVMLALDVEESELKNRLLKRAEVSGRADDADPTIIENRIAVYNKETAPVKNYYNGQDKLISIPGIGTIDEITKRLFTVVDSINA